MEHGYDLVAHRLVERNEPIFGLLGNANLALVARAVELGARFLPSRHETASLSMAAGWAHATGRTGFVTTTGGPGVANSITGLTSAVRDRAPLVYLTGERARGQRPDSQDIDQEGLLRPSGAIYTAVQDPSHLLAGLDDAFEAARVMRGPVVLSVSADILAGAAVPQTPRSTVRDLARWAPGQPPEPDQVHEVASLLMRARRPVILAGRGAVTSGAGPTLRRLGAVGGALLATSLPAHGIFSGEPFSVGFAGGYALPRTRQLLRDSDLVLAVGASLNHYTTDEDRAFPHARIIQVDADPRAIGRERPVDMAIVGDARTVAEALLAEAGGVERWGAGYRTDVVRNHIAATSNGRDANVRDNPEAIDPRTLLRRIDRAIGIRRRIVFDVGHFAAFPSQVFTVHEAGQLVPNLGFASIGLALSTAIGVAIGAPDEDVVAVVGDGGLLMALGELETVARIRPAMTIVVMNDGAYLAEVRHLDRLSLPSDVAVYPRVDFTALGRALGITCLTINSAADLDSLERALASSDTVLIDAHVDPAVVSDKFVYA